MSRRSKAFLSPLPAGWSPQKGEFVYVRPYSREFKGFGNIAYAKIAEMLLKDVALIEFHYGGRRHLRQISVDDLRPPR
jgi:hypothetical protein